MLLILVLVLEFESRRDDTCNYLQKNTHQLLRVPIAWVSTIRYESKTEELKSSRDQNARHEAVAGVGGACYVTPALSYG